MITKKNNIFKNKRVLMLAPDIAIDRRILVEAETLIDEGYEVYLIAGGDENQSEFEQDGRVRIERIKFNGVEHRLLMIYSIHGKVIQKINSNSLRFNNFCSKLSGKGTNFIMITRNKVISAINKFSLFGQKIFGKLSVLSRKSRVVNKIMWIALKLFLKCIEMTGKLSNKSLLLLTKIYQFIILLIVKGHNFIVTSFAKLINIIVNYTIKISTRLFTLTAYEDRFYQRALFYRPDIIHVHDLPMLKIGVKIKEKLNIPLVYDMHEFYPEQPRLSQKQQSFLRRTEKKYVNSADRVIMVNFMLGDVVKERYNLKSIDIVQNAIKNESEYIPGERYDRFREDYPQLKDKFLLLYQGWIAPERNLENAIKAMSYVKSDKWVLLIMGYGDYAEDLKALAKEMNVENKVVFVPAKPQSTLLTYSASADIGLIPYPTNKDLNTHYVSPNKLYEFIEAGLPILTNQLPYVKHVVEQNSFGLVADMDNPQSFAEAIDKIDIIRLIDFKKNLKENGYKYSWENEKCSLINLYEQIN